MSKSYIAAVDNGDTDAANSNEAQTQTESQPTGTAATQRQPTLDAPPEEHEGGVSAGQAKPSVNTTSTERLRTGSQGSLVQALARFLSLSSFHATKKVGHAPGVGRSLRAIVFGSCRLQLDFGLKADV